MRVSLVAAAVGLLAGFVAPVRSQDQGVDPRSLMTTPVWLLEQDRVVSQGTGFFFGNPGPDGTTIETVFLVTNYHVVTGRAPLSAAPRQGDRVRIILHEDPSRPQDIRQVDLPLYDDDGRPLWVSSTTHAAADLVLVPVPEAAWIGAQQYVFTEAHTRIDIKVRPTSPTTLLGYPFGFYDTLHFLPIWKTGHVASEPDVDFEGRPAFLVDVSVFPGMSGSPVLAVSNGIYESENGSLLTGRATRLLGIFSATPVVRQGGRDLNGLSSNGSVETSLQLGYVWKASLIAELARSYQTGR